MFIVAEVGSNWSSRDDCIQSIQRAKSCGADAVKFQLFSSEELYGSDLRPLAHSMPREWVPVLAQKAEFYKIEFMITAFSPEGLKYVDPFVKRHKIASSDLCYTELLEAAKSTQKPIILSTGGHSLGDVEYALKVLNGHKNLTLLYCESNYPAYDIDIRKVELLEKYGFPVGISDHSREVFSVPALAELAGCTVLEKHCNFVEATGPDSPHSLNLTQFTQMVSELRDQRTEPNLLSPYEKEMTLMHNRRIIAKADIKQGDTFKYEENYGVYRSLKEDTEGFHPSVSLKLHGKISAKDISKGEPIGPKGVQQ